LRTPLQVVFAFWSIPLIIHAFPNLYGAYGFAWGFGFFQMLLEFGMSSALQRQVADTWTRGDRQGVDRAVACGMNFYAAMALVQAAVLLGIAYFGVPAKFSSPEQQRLIVKLLCLQAITAPSYGISAVNRQRAPGGAAIRDRPQAGGAGRHPPVPDPVGRPARGARPVRDRRDADGRPDPGVAGPGRLGSWSRSWGHVPRFGRARLADYAPLLHISFFMALIQVSVVLADKVDQIILGYALNDPNEGITIYQAVSKPFLQIRQTGWMLAYLVMPAAASLIAARR